MATFDNRLSRRTAGLLCKRMPELKLERVRDPRMRANRKRPLGVLLGACVVGLSAGVKSLAELEIWTSQLSKAMLRLLGIRGRVPDTSLRDVLVRLRPSDLRARLHRQVKMAKRRKALEPDGLPFSVVTMDGKTTVVPTQGGRYVQKQDDGCHVIRTVTCALTSSRAKVCIDAIPIPADTNEVGFFQTALRALLAAYGKKFFRVVDYDAGATSLGNATFVVKSGLDYFFRVKGNQPTLLGEAVRLLGRARPLARSEDTIDNSTTVIREVSVTDAMAGFLDWKHLGTVIRVRARKVVGGETVSDESRYWVSSLAATALSAAQWLQMARNHWAVENENHHTFDTAFQEDRKPWITKDAAGFLVVLLLRRIAYNQMALFRSVTLRAEQNRLTPWKQLMRWFAHMAMVLTETESQGLTENGRIFATI